MQDTTTKKIVRLLQPDHPTDVRCAAALVLGEVGTRDAELAKMLCERLQDGDRALRLQVIKSIGKLRVEHALPQLLERIKEGGEEAEASAQAVAHLGAKGTKALQDLMPKVAPGLRRYIAAALAAEGAGGAETAGLAVLLDKDPAVIEAALRSLLGQVPSLDGSHREALAEQLLHMLTDKKHPLPPPSESAVVRLLVALGDPKAEAALWDRVLPPHPPEVRAAALAALGRWVSSPGKEQLKRLLTCAAERDFRVAAPALFILKTQSVTDRTLPEWLTLLQAPDVAARHFGVEKLGDRDNEAVAAALLEQVSHPDRGLREEALSRLTRLEHGRTALTKAFLEAPTADRAWPLAKAQAPFVKNYPADWRETVFDQLCTHLEAGDRRTEPLLFLLREADAADLRERIEKRALTLRKKEDYANALHYLRLLTRDPACGFPIRLEHAACGLKVSSHDLTAEAREADPCLHHFINLCQNYETELAEELEKFDWLGPEDLYYLGFHFAEKEGRQKHFAEKVLHLLLKRSPRSKLAQAAKAKLRGTGLD